MALKPSPLHIVHAESSCGWGGQEIRVLTEAQGMIERGHRVTLLCPSESNIYRQAPAYGIPTVAMPIAQKRLRGLLALRAWLKNRPDIDVINSHSSTDAWLTALACVSLKSRPPVVRTRHVSTPVRKGSATRWLYQDATSHIVTTGEALRTRLIQENRFDPARITSVPTGIDLARFTPGQRSSARRTLDLDPEAVLIGSVATLRIWKGHRYLIQAMTSLPANVCLVIVGDGPQRTNLEQQANTLGLAGRVLFAGQQQDVVPWLQAFDIFVLPSYQNEGVPQAILQAMAVGLPVIACPIGSVGEVVEHETTGLLVTPQNSEALVLALRRWLEQAGERQRLGQAGRQKALAGFSLATMLDEMESVFHGVAKRGGRDQRR
jgi:glycosyltransferase involved in cell wall biosynthesis